MSGGPPRARPRAVPPAQRQPYPPADDLEVTVEEEPIPLSSEYVPTMRDLSEQIGAVSSHLTVVHKEAALARSAAVAASASAEAARGEIAEVRRLVVGDHAPRLTEVARRVDDVEKRVPITIPPMAKKGGALVGAAAIYPLLEWLIPLATKWIESR